MANSPTKTVPAYTVCQHSAWMVREDTTFKQGLELTCVEHLTKQRRVLAEGGILFETWKDGDAFEHEAAYHSPAYKGMTPDARGTFSKLKLNGLCVYIPHAKDFEICVSLGLKFRCQNYVVGSLSTVPSKTESESSAQ